jgi:hypothetical protein
MCQFYSDSFPFFLQPTVISICTHKVHSRWIFLVKVNFIIFWQCDFYFNNILAVYVAIFG